MALSKIIEIQAIKRWNNTEMSNFNFRQVIKVSFAGLIEMILWNIFTNKNVFLFPGWAVLEKEGERGEIMIFLILNFKICIQVIFSHLS